MKNLLLIISLLFSFTVFAQIEKVVPSRPTPPRLVNDIAGKLTSEQRQTLEEKLDQYDRSTSNQIAIVILPTITDAGGTEYPIEEVGLKIIRDWGVGTKKNNNGVIIVVAMAERKMRIETGYGLEGAIPDVTAKAIIDNDIKPAFREENYYRGFDNAINSIMKAAEGEYKAPPGYGKKGKGGAGFGKLIIAVIVLFIILSMFGGGGRGGGYMSRRGYRGWTGPVIFPGGWGGSSGGGGWSGGGGGFGGGGFGGFGGGSGGGGGASGSW